MSNWDARTEQSKPAVRRGRKATDPGVAWTAGLPAGEQRLRTSRRRRILTTMARLNVLWLRKPLALLMMGALLLSMLAIAPSTTGPLRAQPQLLSVAAAHPRA